MTFTEVDIGLSSGFTLAGFDSAAISTLTAPEVEALAERGIVLEEKIGAGSYASVFSAVCHDPPECQMRLACKVFDSSKVPREYQKKFFPRELDILMRVSHSNIISLHSILQRGSKIFIFMRFAECGDLLEWVQKKGPVPEGQARRWFKQLVSALQYLHGMDIAHRDLKCENILLSRHYNIKVADFGFARLCVDGAGRRELSRTFCGSAAYAAPEIVSAVPYNPKMADVWSLGVVLFIMLNGIMPFDDTNLVRLLRHQVLKSWTFRRKVRNSVSSIARSLVRQILEPDLMRRLRLDAIARHRWLEAPLEAGDEGHSTHRTTEWSTR